MVQVIAPLSLDWAVFAYVSWAIVQTISRSVETAHFPGGTQDIDCAERYRYVETLA